MLLHFILLFNLLLNIKTFFLKYSNNKINIKRNINLIKDGSCYFKCNNKNKDECIKFQNLKNKQINDSEEVNIESNFYRYGTNPRIDKYNEIGILTWYPIGFKKDFGKNPQRIIIRDINYIVWRDDINYYALRDCCSHQGSSFMFGRVNKNTISCPYHGYIFDGSNGELLQIPKLQYIESSIHNVDCFKVIEKGDIVYLNTISLKNDEMRNQLDESGIFTEPEYFDKNQRCIILSKDFEHYAKFVSVNSLDICHIGFVHTFGNKKNPNPIHNSKVIKILDNENHYYDH